MFQKLAGLLHQAAVINVVYSKCRSYIMSQQKCRERKGRRREGRKEGGKECGREEEKGKGND